MRELLWKSAPEMEETAKFIFGDLEQIVRLREIAKPAFDDPNLLASIEGTYAGNTFVTIRNSLARELAIVSSRLFHAPVRDKKTNAINFEESDRSLLLAIELIKTPKT